MTREQIEQAVHRSWIERHIGNHALTNDEVDGFNPLPSENFKEGFIAGAEWRINSVWHKVGEVPINDKIILVCNECAVVCVVKFDVLPEKWYEYVISNDIVRWAYVEDLLPTEGGVE